MASGGEDVDSLVARALAARGDEERWAAVRKLHARTDRSAFARACALARSPRSDERTLGLDVLGQLGYPAGQPFRDETLPVLVAACDDPSPEVLNAAVTALGHLSSPRGLPAVLRHVTHASQQVRFATAAALPQVAGDPPAAGAVAALIGLTSDPDPQVRDWATMGLSGLDADGDAVRDALAARLADPDSDTAGEALVGLALRNDPRAKPVLLSWLQEANPGSLVVEAAAELGDPAALPFLLHLRQHGWPGHDPGPSPLDRAIAACSRPAPDQY